MEEINIMNFNEKHVEESLGHIRVIFQQASTRLEALKPGGKVTATGLAEELAKEHGTTMPALYPVLKFFINTLDKNVWKISRGAHGGIERLPAVDTTATKI